MCSSSLRVFNNPFETIPIDTEIVDEGIRLYRDFLRDEIVHVGFERNIISSLESLYKDTNYKWAKYGAELRQIADAFSQTKEKEIIDMKAQSVTFNGLTQNVFRDLLTEIFYSVSFTHQRIFALFTFSSKLAIRALKISKIDKFFNIVYWSLDYIKEKVCTWVQANGGWSAVLCHESNSSSSFSAIVAASLGLSLVLIIAIQIIRNH